ncbi:MAG: tetratricopeptide repeat protein [Elusimicrobiota bacterium]
MKKAKTLPIGAAWTAAVFLAAFSAFLPALRGGWVWDDMFLLTENPVFFGPDWPDWGWMLTAFHMGHWMPLTWASYAWDRALWGLNPAGYHLANLLLHTAGAAVFHRLAVGLLARAKPALWRARPAALAAAAGLAALVFALHPLRVESVAWITERRDVLSGLFILLSSLAYLRHADGNRRAGPWYWACLGLFAASLTAKAIGMVLPVIFLILDFYPLRRIQTAGGAARRVWLEKIPFFLLSLPVMAAAAAAQKSAGAVVAWEAHGAAARLLQACFGAVFYLGKTIFPFGLSPLYELDRFELWRWPFLASGVFVLGASWLAFRERRRRPAWAAAWAGYLVFLAPVSGVFQSGIQFAADRYTYLASLPWALLAGAGAGLWWTERKPAALRRTALAAASAARVLLAALAWRQSAVWQSSETLWRRAVSLDPGSRKGRLNLGLSLAETARWEEAREQFQRALDIGGESAEIYDNIGYTLLMEGRGGEAAAHFRKALALAPEYSRAHNNLGTWLMSQGKPEEAALHFRRAL